VIKSEKIPEDIRSAVMNIFRMPLNAFVVVLLLKIKFLSSQVVFLICTATHGMAFLSYLYFYTYTKIAVPESSKSSAPVFGRQTSEMEMHMREMLGSRDDSV
jgi:hypothetical protein